MTRQFQIFMNACAASALSYSVLAQTAPAAKNDAPFTGERAPYTQRQARLNDVAKARDVIGMTVKNNQDERLGKVEDLAIDLPSGRVLQAIISVGGFAGVGDTLIAVPPGALQRDAEHKILRLDADKEKLKNAPRFETSKWAEDSDSTHLSKVYSYYGEEPAYGFVQAGESSPNTASTRQPDGTWKDRTITDRRGMIPASRLAKSERAGKVIGMSVRNLQNEKLGKVENILVDLPAGRIVAVVISSGGFLGMGDEFSAVPPSALSPAPKRDTLQMEASTDALRNAPHFKSGNWPDFSQSDYTAGVYRAYQVDPYFSSVETRTDAQIKDADNTARNARDRDNRTLTPLDQGESRADLDITAQIRKQVVALKDVSTDAKNVKIITKNGHVHLRGPVNTPEEKRRIEEIATNVAGAGNVDDRLEVKLTANNN
jgi:sporulation protein YlmC with PRC-barrel domain